MKKINQNRINKEIPIFFATDDNYVPCMVVSMQSLIETASIKNRYVIHILNRGLTEENRKIIKNMERSNIRISFVNVNNKVKSILAQLTEQLRDYYSPSIYYRLFIATLFPKYKKAIYLDGDITILRDIADMYNKDLKNNLVGAVVDEVVSHSEVFCEHMEKGLGVDSSKYFNSGVLLMNLEAFRKEKIEQKFIYLLKNYPFSPLCPDQDYLNFLCQGKVLFMEKGWDKMPIEDETFDENDLYLVHYNMFQKPWRYYDVLFDKYFWDVAKRTPFYDYMLKSRESYTAEQREADFKAGERMLTLAKGVIEDPNNFKRTYERAVQENVEKKDEILHEIECFFGEMFNDAEDPVFAN